MPGKSFVTKSHQWWIDKARFWDRQRALLETVKSQDGVFASDAMIAWGRTLGFLDDEAFLGAWDRRAKNSFERGVLWRSAVLVWAARTAKRRDGDFAEFGCYAGTSSRIVMDVVPTDDRRVWLYDLFETPPGVPPMPDHGPSLYDQTRALFPEPNVEIIRGLIPDSFELGLPDKIAFAHIDLNNAGAEIATLDAIEPRLVPGAVIVLDDFGQLPYYRTHEAEVAWFAKRGLAVLEIPTGQGIVIW